MPKRLTVETGPEDLGEQEIAAYEAIAQVLDSLGDAEAVIRISRRGKSGGLEFCEQVPVDPTFGPQYLKDNWGGGVYSVQFWGPKAGESGVHYLKQVTVKVAGQPKEKKDPEELAAARSTGADPVTVQLQLELATLKGMLAGMQTKGDGGNPLDNLEKLTTIVRNLMPAPAPAGGMGAGEVFGIVRDVMSLSKEMAPESGEGTPWGMIIDKAVEPAIGLIGQALSAQKAGTATPEALGAPNPPPQISSPVGAPMWQVELSKVVPRLLIRARAGKDPALAAELFVEDAPGGALVELEKLAKEHPAEFVPTILQLAEQYFPDVTPVRSWVEQFLLSVQELLTEEEPAAITDAAPALVVDAKPKKKPAKPEGATDVGTDS